MFAQQHRSTLFDDKRAKNQWRNQWQLVWLGRFSPWALFTFCQQQRAAHSSPAIMFQTSSHGAGEFRIADYLGHRHVNCVMIRKQTGKSQFQSPASMLVSTSSTTYWNQHSVKPGSADIALVNGMCLQKEISPIEKELFLWCRKINRPLSINLL